MRAAFRMVCSEGASFLKWEEMERLAAEAVRECEKIEPKSKNFILNRDRGLKVLVRWFEREVWIMSIEEAVGGGLPSPSDN